MAWTIKYNVTVKAAATVRPAGELRVVQPEIEGAIKTILVKENQSVIKGQIIAQLDNSQQEIKKSQLQGNIQQLNLQIVQINAQIQSLNTQILAEEQSINRAIVAAEAELARNQREHEDRKITTQTELLAAEAQLQKEKADLQKAQADLGFAQLEANRYQILLKSSAISANEFDKKLLAVKQAKSALASMQKTVDIALARRKSSQTALNPSNATVAIAHHSTVYQQWLRNLWCFCTQ
nr:biotin/lipoyl-binding protein [Scytonema hofmannii]